MCEREKERDPFLSIHFAIDGVNCAKLPKERLRCVHDAVIRAPGSSGVALRRLSTVRCSPPSVAGAADHHDAHLEVAGILQVDISVELHNRFVLER